MSNQMLRPFVPWALFALAAALVVALVWFIRWFRGRRARKALRLAVTAVAADHVIDALVPDGMGAGFHVDFLLLSVHGILIIDVREVQGNIFGGDQMSEWTVMDGAHRFTFVNPQSGLYDRIAAVRAIAGEVPVEGRVVFTRQGKFPKGLPKWTLMLDTLAAEFPPLDNDVRDAALGQYREGWERVRAAVRPSSMKHMR
ncbi:conserved hypothetical protein, secreted [mine drainage metagenome]|uniref:NERD domain-containing protein n=1 Tax=mine drainage metagenome TaxID=410659 RepID=T1A0F9_9ZZZZ